MPNKKEPNLCLIHFLTHEHNRPLLITETSGHVLWRTPRTKFLPIMA